MSIPAIPSLNATGPTTSVFGPGGAGGASPTGAADPAGGSKFADSLLSVVDNTSDAINKSSQLGQAAATGQLRNVHDYMIASAEASTSLEMTVALKNEAVRAFQSVMNTPV